MSKKYFVYLLANKINTVIYTGVTSDIRKRIIQHKKGLFPGFTKKYNVHKLVYCEEFNDIRDAILREKQIKAGSRAKKVTLIEKNNKDWKDLFDYL